MRSQIIVLIVLLSCLGWIHAVQLDSSTHHKSAHKLKQKSKSRHQSKHRVQSKTVQKEDKTLSERAAGEDVDTSITKDILEAAANDIESSQSEDFEITSDGAVKVNSAEDFDIEEVKTARKVEDKKVETPKPAKALTQTKAKAAEIPAELAPASKEAADKADAAATPDASGSTGKEEKKAADKADTAKADADSADKSKSAKSGGKSAVPSGKAKGKEASDGKGASASGHNGFLNWWDEDGSHGKETHHEDNEPDEIKDHPEYKKLVNRFLGGLFKDEGLERASKKSAIDTVEADEIKSTKEREGFYPNELDQEMKGYTYGDRLPVQWTAYGQSPPDYSSYMRSQGTFAPPFDPNGHFETPYYEYGNHSWGNQWQSGGGYWNHPGFDYNPWLSVYAQKNNGTLPTPAVAQRLFEQANVMAMSAMAQKHNTTSNETKPANLNEEQAGDKSMHDIINEIVEQDPTVLSEQIDEKKKEEQLNNQVSVLQNKLKKAKQSLAQGGDITIAPVEEAAAPASTEKDTSKTEDECAGSMYPGQGDCWAATAYQKCPLNRQGAYDLVNKAGGNTSAAKAAYEKLTSLGTFEKVSCLKLATSSKDTAKTTKKAASADSGKNDTSSANKTEEAEEKEEEDPKEDVVEDDSKSSPSATGISMVQFTAERKDDAEKLIDKLFLEHLIADAEVIDNNYERIFMKYRKQILEDNLVKLKFVTTDAKVPRLMRYIKKENPNEHNPDLAPDIFATKLSSGSDEYIKWVKTQVTEKKEKEQTKEDEDDD